MTKIAIDARELRTTTGRYIERLLFYLQQIDQQHDYVVLLKPDDVAGWQPTNPRFGVVPCPHKEFTFAEQGPFKKQLDGLKPDLVHFPMVQQPVRYVGKTITTMNDLTTVRFSNPNKNSLVFWFKQRVYRWVNRRVAHKANALLTYSQFVKDDVVQFSSINPDKITVTPLAADPIIKHGEPVDALMHKEFIMYVGRPLPHKNLERLLDAFAGLLPQHPNLYLALAGKKDGNYERIERIAKSKGLESNVIFTGFVTDQQLRWMYEHCAAYVFPSLSEGFGLPGLEAMVHGAPVASSNATCLPEVYGEAAHYFNPLDVTAMAVAINDVLTNPQLRQQLIMAGREQAAKYSWQRMAEQTLAVYKQVLGE